MPARDHIRSRITVPVLPRARRHAKQRRAARDVASVLIARRTSRSYGSGSASRHRPTINLATFDVVLYSRTRPQPSVPITSEKPTGGTRALSHRFSSRTRTKYHASRRNATARTHDTGRWRQLALIARLTSRFYGSARRCSNGRITTRFQIVVTLLACKSTLSIRSRYSSANDSVNAH